MAPRSAGSAVILGCGTVGSQAASWLARHGPFAHLLLVDIDGGRAADLARRLPPGLAHPLQADATSPEPLAQVFRGARVVVNTVGPFFRHARTAVESALVAGVDYVDVNDDADSLGQLLYDSELHRRALRQGRTLVLGAGTSPGITAHLARIGASLLDRVDAFQVYLAASISWRGRAVFAHFIHALGRPARFYLGGRWREAPPFSGEEEVTFLGVEGPVRCYSAGHPEPVTFPRFFRGLQEVTMKLGRVPNSHMDLLRDLYRYGLMSEEPVSLGGQAVSPAEFLSAFLASDLADRLFGFSRNPPLSARLVRARGLREGRPTVVECYYTSGSVTGQDAAIIASLLALGRLDLKGVCGPEAVEPWPVMEALLREGGQFRVVCPGAFSVGSLEEVQALRRDRPT